MLRGVCRAGVRVGLRSAAPVARVSAVQATPVAWVPRRFCSFSDEEKTEIMDEMKNDIKSSPVVLFMKGEPEQPRCGFSSKSVEVLKQYGVAYTSYNVLAHPAVREGIKEISGWPTIPQLFVAGEFVGGCDLMLEMHQSGDLADIFQSNNVAFRHPQTGITHTPVQGAGKDE